MNGFESSRKACDSSGLAGRKVLVMGLGRFGGGVDAARYAAQSGARVVVTEDRKSVV